MKYGYWWHIFYNITLRKKATTKNALINMDNTISLTIIQGPEWLNELGSWIT